MKFLDNPVDVSVRILLVIYMLGLAYINNLLSVLYNIKSTNNTIKL